MTPYDLAGFFWAAFGLVLGSYLNVVVYRLPLGLSTAYPGSRCPRCLMPVRPWHNVPVLSWIVLQARCKDCHGRISARYPLVEALVGLWFWLSYRQLATAVDVLVSSLLGALLLALTLIDWDRRLVPQIMTWPALVLLVAVAPWLSWISLAEAALGAIVGVAGGVAIDRVARVLGSDDAFGAGDTQVLGLIGSFLGWRLMLGSFVLAALVVTLWALLRVLLSQGRGLALGDLQVPFVSFLAPAALVVFAIGPLRLV